MGFGDNAKAALMTRGLAEISRLGEKGADPITFLGLGGIGDLIVTCTSTHSRNYTLGYKLGEGKSLDKALDEMNMVVEGIYTTKSVYHLAKEVDVDMPITAALYSVLFENRPVDESVKDLMGRERKQNNEVLLHFLVNLYQLTVKILLFQRFLRINHCSSSNRCVKVIA